MMRCQFIQSGIILSSFPPLGAAAAVSEIESNYTVS
jgi:hypothetical protein